jgi:hypothetical protein
MFFTKFFVQRLPGMLVLVCLCVTGCDGNVKVTGSVTYSDNGEPVRSGSVVFLGEKDTARGTIKDGKYAAGLIKDGDGIPLGQYVVSADSLENPVYESVNMDGTRSEASAQPQEIYYTKEPKTVDVTKSMTYDFTVERGKRP